MFFTGLLEEVPVVVGRLEAVAATVVEEEEAEEIEDRTDPVVEMEDLVLDLEVVVEVLEVGLVTTI